MAAICFIPPVMIILTPAAGRARVRLRRFIDGATISAALAFPTWHFVIAPTMDLVAPGMQGMTAVAPGLEIISFALALVALSRSRSSDGNALILMELALVVLSVATLADIYNVSFGLERFANGVGGAYLSATLIMALSSRSSLSSRAADHHAGREGPWGWLPYLPVGICFGTAAYLQSREGSLDPVLFWVLLCTAVLVLVRQFLNLRTNQDLLRRVDEQRERLAHLAFHDPLTGLANRAMLSDRAGAALAGAADDSTTALLLVDLDGFKAVNDTYGHAAGDELLMMVAACLRRCVRPEDLVVRLGGDEFVVFMPDLDGAADAERIGQRILRELDQPLTVGGTRMPVRGSAGLAVTRGPGAAPDTLLRDADVALYQAKAAGKNRMCLFPQSPALTGGTPPELPLLAG
jgi:diguanylate cyclase (GGDEF)-like protein